MTISLEVLAALAAALVAGLGAGYAWASAAARQKLAIGAAQAETRIAQTVAEVSDQKARLETQLAAERSAHVEKLKAYEDAEQRLQQAFAALSNAALNANTSQFLTVAAKKLEEMQGQSRLDLDARRQGIEDLLKPMKETLTQVTAKLGQVENARREDYGQLAQRLEGLNRETTALGRALRTPQGRGRWGELQLRRVVELSGMIDRCDFDEQVSVRGDGAALRPDLLVHLPGRKVVIVDAKAPLSAYLEASEMTEGPERDEKLKQHAAQMRAHIDQLSAKAYWQQFPTSPEFVVMFLPGEAIFRAAIQADLSLIEFGAERKVIAASPLSLLALLRSVAYGWSQEALADNARKISDAGRELYDRLGTMAEHLADLRRRLEGAVDAYNKSVGSLEARVLPAARKLKDLGVSVSKEIDVLGPIEHAPRQLQAAELVPETPGVAAVDAEVLPGSLKPLAE